MLQLLKKLEWSGYAEAEPLSRQGGAGERVPACPCCGGIHPDKGANFFVAQALGHREGCELSQEIKRSAQTEAVHSKEQRLSLRLAHVSDDPNFKLKKPVTAEVIQAEEGGEISVNVDGYRTLSMYVNDDGEVRLRVPGGSENKELLLAEGRVFQASHSLADMQEGEVLDVGEGCLYDIKSLDERSGAIHLILEGDDGVWHLEQEAETRLVPSQTQDGLWALPESAVDTPKLKQIY